MPIPNILEKIKQARQMRDLMKEFKKELDKLTAEYENGGVKVVAHGNMSIDSIQITRDDVRKAGVTDEFLALVKTNTNKALRLVEAQCQQRMMAESKAMGMDKFLDV